MIRFQCPACQMVLQAPEERSGARTACPRCRQPVQVPTVEPKPSAPEGTRPAPAVPGSIPAASIQTQQLPASVATPLPLPASQPATGSGLDHLPPLPTETEAPALILEPSPEIPLALEVESKPKPKFTQWATKLSCEIKTAAGMTFAHVRSVLVYFRHYWRCRQLSHAALTHQENLGKSLYGAQLGDAQLREQIDLLEFPAEGTTAKQTGRRRRELFRQLADPILTQPAPAAVHGEWVKARAARVTLQQQQQVVDAKRSALRPSGLAEWGRIAAGYGTLGSIAALVLLVPLVFLRSSRPSATSTQPVASIRNATSRVPEIVIRGTNPNAIPGWIKTIKGTASAL